MENRKIQRHRELVDTLMELYDGDMQMFYEDVDNPNAYHTRLKKGRFHRYKYNATYAVALMDTEREKDIPIANAILKSVIDGQCKKEGDTFGLWPYFYEESLEDMDMPDWNMADFQGIELFQILLDHFEKVEDSLKEPLIQAISDACECIMRRNVTISYTNVTAMDIYLCIAFGERYNDRIFEYGMKKLDLFHEIVIGCGYFQEYNSPTYTIVLTDSLSLMLEHIKNEAALKKINELNDLAWNGIAKHYHPATGQWTGTQNRAYTQFIKDGTRGYFEKALNYTVSLKGENKTGQIKKYQANQISEGMLADIRYKPKCPEKYADWFVNPEKQISYVQETDGNRRYAKCYMTPEYVIGTTNVSIGWNQHRNLLAYFGDKKDTYCLWQRAMHNGYDYSSTRMYIQQADNAALSMVIFYTDGADTHCSLDPTNGKIKAKDLRISYQIEAIREGIIDKIEVIDKIKEENKVIFIIAGTKVEIGCTYAEFSGEKPYIEIKKDGKFLCFDIVFYNGDEKEFVLDEIQEAMSVSWLLVNSENCDIPVTEENGDIVTAEWKINNNELKLQSTNKPAPVADMGKTARQWADGKEVDSKFY